MTVPWRKLAGSALVAMATLILADVVLSWMLHRSLLPSALSAAIHGLPEYTRLVADTLPTREPGLDVTYRVDRERYGDLVSKGQMSTDLDSGDGAEMVRLRTDPLGFRSVEDHTSCDVAILGDSFTEAANLGEHDAYPLILDRRLEQRVCNLSIAAVGTWQQAEFLERWGLPRRPRLVLLAFFEGNDPEDNVNFAAIRRRQAAAPLWRRLLRRRPIPRLVRALGRGGRPETVRTAAGRGINPVVGTIGDRALTLGFYDAYISRLAESQPEFAQSQAWQITRGYLDRISAACEATGVELALVYLPSKPHVYLPYLTGSVSADALRDIAGRTDERASAFVDRLRDNADARRDQLRSWARSQGAGFIDLTAALQEHAARGEKLFFSWDTHMNATGHEIVASRVEAGLREFFATPGR